MKRRILGYVAVMVTVICLCAAPSFAADNAKIGFGFQGLIAGNMLNGASVRAWLGPNTAIGLEGNLFYGALEVDDTDIDADLFMLEIKAMYAFIIKTNSRFYAGGKFAYGQYDLDPYNFEGKMYIPGIFVGAEWNFPSLPEVGFNFDVGYNYVIDNNEIDGNDVDLNLQGVNVALGIKYYF